MGADERRSDQDGKVPAISRRRLDVAVCAARRAVKRIGAEWSGKNFQGPTVNQVARMRAAVARIGRRYGLKLDVLWDAAVWHAATD